MPSTRKRASRGFTGSVSAWVGGYIKNGKIPEKGTDDYEEWCSYELLNLNVRGLPEKNKNGFWFVDHKGK